MSQYDEGFGFRTLLVAAVITLCGTYAFAGCPNDPEVDREARSYLTSCAYPAGSSDLASCQRLQESFVSSYQRAWGGNNWAQHDVAGTLAHGGYGVARNRVQGCAWRLVSAVADLAHVDPVEVEDAARYCQPIDPMAFNLAKARAQQIITGMQAAGAVEWPGMDDPCAD